MKKNIYLVCFIVIVLCSSKVFTQNHFVPDTTVNNIFFLYDASSSESFFPSMTSVNVLDEDFKFLQEQSPFIVFLNVDKTQYLITFMHEGGVSGAFAEIEIGYITEEILKEIENKYFETAYEEFQTEGGVKLGMTLENLEALKGKNYIREGNIVTYFINDASSDFLRKYNMPEYFFKCDLLQNKICNLRFGFTYP